MTRWKPSSKKTQRRSAPRATSATRTTPASRAAAGNETTQKGNARLRDSGGRVHLKLIPTRPGGPLALELQAPVFEHSWQNELAVSTASTALNALSPRPTRGAVTALARQVMAAVSTLSDGLLAQAPKGQVACRAGCDHCCYQSVGVTPPEALAIADHLRTTRTEAELAEAVSRLKQLVERTRGLTSQERYHPDYPCAFLRDGCCSIYEVRPLSCRGMNALDAEECAAQLRTPERRRAFLATGTGGRSFLEPIRAFHATSAGLQLSLNELFGLDMSPLDLAAAVLLLLQSPDGVVESWLDGGSPLASARGGDSSANRGAAALSGSLTSWT